MAIEDEYLHIYQNMQGRYEDGHRTVIARSDICNADEMVVKEYEVEIPVPQPRGLGTVWTPNQFTAYCTTPQSPRYRKRIV